MLQTMLIIYFKTFLRTIVEINFGFLICICRTVLNTSTVLSHTISSTTFETAENFAPSCKPLLYGPVHKKIMKYSIKVSASSSMY